MSAGALESAINQKDRAQCPYLYRGRVCMNFGLLRTKWAVRNGEVSVFVKSIETDVRCVFRNFFLLLKRGVGSTSESSRCSSYFHSYARSIWGAYAHEEYQKKKQNKTKTNKKEKFHPYGSGINTTINLFLAIQVSNLVWYCLSRQKYRKSNPVLRNVLITCVPLDSPTYCCLEQMRVAVACPSWNFS